MTNPMKLNNKHTCFFCDSTKLILCLHTNRDFFLNEKNGAADMMVEFNEDGYIYCLECKKEMPFRENSYNGVKETKRYFPVSPLKYKYRLK